MDERAASDSSILHLGESACDHQLIEVNDPGGGLSPNMASDIATPVEKAYPRSANTVLAHSCLTFNQWLKLFAGSALCLHVASYLGLCFNVLYAVLSSHSFLPNDKAAYLALIFLFLPFAIFPPYLVTLLGSVAAARCHPSKRQSVASWTGIATALAFSIGYLSMIWASAPGAVTALNTLLVTAWAAVSSLGMTWAFKRLLPEGTRNVSGSAAFSEQREPPSV